MDIDKQKQGRRNRAAGARWELSVRKYLETEGYYVSKFQSNVDLAVGKLIPAKPSTRFRRGTLGFPDYIIWRVKHRIVRIKDENICQQQVDKIKEQLERHKDSKFILTSPNIEIIPENEIIGVECKCHRGLDRIEKEKCRWLLENNVFEKIYIARKKKVGRKVVPELIDFAEKYMKDSP